KDKCTSMQDRWRVFAEREMEAVFRGSLLYAGIQWLRDDLFIQMRLPAGRQTILEGWLLEVALKHTSEWEQQFAEELDTQGSKHFDGKLHVGVAVVADDSHLDDLVWYEAMKKAILHGQSAGAMEHSLKLRAIEK